MKTVNQETIKQAVTDFEEDMKWLRDYNNPAVGYISVKPFRFSVEDRYIHGSNYIEVEERWNKSHLSVMNRFKNFPQIEKRLDRLFDNIKVLNDNEDLVSIEDKLIISQVLTPVSQIVFGKGQYVYNRSNIKITTSVIE